MAFLNWLGRNIWPVIVYCLIIAAVITASVAIWISGISTAGALGFQAAIFVCLACLALVNI